MTVSVITIIMHGIMFETVKYNNNQELWIKCQHYFAFCDNGEMVQVARKTGVKSLKQPIPYTLPGLALFLGLDSRKELLDLGKNPTLSRAVVRAVSSIEDNRLHGALSGGQNYLMAALDLKNNHSYVDKQEITTTHKIEYTDDELQQRLTLMEQKVLGMEQANSAPLIEGDFRVKLLE